MRILHTADWHLGHRLYGQDRTEEHRILLRWLLRVVEEESVDVVIVSGDIFDVTNPSNQARNLYYRFLAGLTTSRAQAAVIVGGNHDSPGMLDAPGEILKSLNLHVVGRARARVQDQVVKIEVQGTGGRVEPLVVAAVPFLRERDVRTGRFGESADERLNAIREGIARHFKDIGAAAEAARTSAEIPIIATGHLFAGGADDLEDKRSTIYQADENNIEADLFPPCFDYVALGHIHRAQAVDERDHVRYAGSLVPLTFLEGQRARSVSIVDIDGPERTVTTRRLYAPYARQLYRMQGSLDEVRRQITSAVAELEATGAGPAGLTPWVEVRVRSDERLPNLKATLLDCLAGCQTRPDAASADPPLRFLRISCERATPLAPASAPTPLKRLDELKPEEVFQRVCLSGGVEDAATAELIKDFRDLVSWYQEHQSA